MSRAAGGSHPGGQARVDAILDTVVQLVMEVGCACVTVDAIATRAGVSKATIYRRWPTKTALVADALQRQIEHEWEVQLPDTGSVSGDLMAGVGQIARSLGDEGGPTVLALLPVVRGDSMLREQVRTQIDAASDRAAAVIIERARVRGDSHQYGDVALVLGIAVGQLVTMAMLDGAAPDETQQRRLLDDILIPLIGLRLDASGS